MSSRGGSRRHVLAVAIMLVLTWSSLPEVEARSGQVDAPASVELPRDDGPHAVPMEWWYYTGHLFAEGGARYGFQFVVFKGERGGLVAYAAHVAVTDNDRGVYRYDERLVVAGDVSTEVPGGGIAFSIGDWRMSGAGGTDRLVAALPGYALSLKLTSVKPPALHDGDGYVDYGGDQWTYYLSRTRLEVSGALAVDGEPMKVSGLAWMDHQWGDFTTYEDGGWDWFALQLDDGSDLMLYRILAPDGSAEVVDGTLVGPDGMVTFLDADAFSATPTGSWTSPATGTTYPSGWVVEVPDERLELTLTPSLLDQELDTTRSTGQVYWEGEVTVEGTRGGEPIVGLGYVELTGYDDRNAATPLG